MPELPLADRVDVVVDPPPRDVLDRLEAATEREDVAAVVADHPTSMLAWASLARLGRDPVERYAAARVGYHRGLDAVRGRGWGGSGMVRWAHPGNRGFLTCVALLRDAAAEIGEEAEVERLDEFLLFLDAEWDDANVA